MANNQYIRPRRYKGTPLPEAQRRLRPEEILRGFVIGAVVIVVGTFLGQFVFSEIQGRGTAYFILAAVLGIVLTAVAYRRLQIAMILFVLLGWLSVGQTPSLATGMTSGTGKGLALSQIGMAFLLAIWGLRTLVNGRGSFIHTRLNLLLGLYLGICVLSAINGHMFWDPAVAHFWGPALKGGREPIPVTILEIGLRVLSVGAFWLFANNLREESWLRRVSWLLVFPGVVLFAGPLVHLPIAGNEYTLLLWGMVACFLFAWLIEPRLPDARPQKGLRFCGWAFFLLLVAFTAHNMLYWVSIGLDVFTGLFFIAFLRNKRLFAAMVVIAVIAYLSSQGFLHRTVFHKVEHSGDLLRFSMAHAAFLYAMKFPLGVGPGNYRSYNAYYGSSHAWGTSTFTSAHGFYSQMLSELGFGGLIITLAWVVVSIVMLARFYRAMPAGWSRTYVLGIAGAWTGACVGTFLGDYLIPVYHNGGVITLGTTIYSWIALGVAFAHARRYGLVSDEAPARPAAAAPPPAVEYYPRKMGHESHSP